MIGYLKGKVLECSEGKVLVGLGGAGGEGMIGYQVFFPSSHQAMFEKKGESLELYIYTHVREEAFDLYGFLHPEEKELFLILLSVNGVGPKSALGILSAMDAQVLVTAIIQDDQSLLTRVSGIGKKTAERLVLELRDKLKKRVEQGAFFGSATERLDPRAQSSPRKNAQDGFMSPLFQDAKAALLGLGYREPEIQNLFHQLLKDRPEVEFKKPEELIRLALQRMA
ncbi:MAG: Holliday junction branch migration protein RuvA [Bdellovibrionia bacterium]